MKIFNLITTVVCVSVVGCIIYKISTDIDRVVYTTVNPQLRDIAEIIHIPGNVYPTKEIEIKSQLSGVLENVSLKIGDIVSPGTPIASVKLVSSTSDIERLETNVNICKIEFTNKFAEFERAKKLFDAKIIPKAEYEEILRVYLLAEEQLRSAQNQLEILVDGKISSKNISNMVTSSAYGVVIDLPLEIGASIIERNNYNPGTTLAIIAEMEKFKFSSPIAEHYLKHLSLGDTIILTFNAYDDIFVKAVISKISSKGNLDGGVMKYVVDAVFNVADSLPTLRSGYSVTANITLNKSVNAISIEEKYITYTEDSVYVQLWDSIKNYKYNRLITAGLSDGTFTEIVDGVCISDKIIVD